MADFQKTVGWFERAKVMGQGAVIGAVFSDAVGTIMSAPMNVRIVCSLGVAAAGAVLANKYIAQPEMGKGKHRAAFGRQPE